MGGIKKNRKKLSAKSSHPFRFKAWQHKVEKEDKRDYRWSLLAYPAVCQLNTTLRKYPLIPSRCFPGWYDYFPSFKICWLEQTSCRFILNIAGKFYQNTIAFLNIQFQIKQIV